MAIDLRTLRNLEILSVIIGVVTSFAMIGVEFFGWDLGLSTYAYAALSVNAAVANWLITIHPAYKKPAFLQAYMDRQQAEMEAARAKGAARRAAREAAKVAKSGKASKACDAPGPQNPTTDQKKEVGHG